MENLVGQLLVAGFEGTEPCAEILQLIRTYHLGGVILYRRNCADARQVLRLTNRLQEAAREAGAAQPLFIAIDQEQGSVVRLIEGVTLFPAMGVIARAGSPSLVRKVAGVVSRELLSLGINWNLTPVADVLSAPSCPLGDRSFGSEPGRVAEMVAAYIRGASQEGMLSCAKHFPGHGGTSEDSHFSTPVIDRSRAELDSTDLVPFRAAIEAGVPTLMTSHITFPALDPRRPASLSGEVITRILRKELSFRGVVVSDDLEMAGVSRQYPLEESSRLALCAGADLLIVSGMLLPERDLPALLDSLNRAATRGDLPPDLLRLATGRVRDLKGRFLTWSRRAEAGAAVLRHHDHLALREEIRKIADH